MDFSDIFKNGERVQGEILSIHYKKTAETKDVCLGVSVSKKMVPLAVDRNYIKRRITSFFRDETTQKNEGYKIVVRIREEVKEQKAKKISQKIEEELKLFLEKVK